MPNVRTRLNLAICLVRGSLSPLFPFLERRKERERRKNQTAPGMNGQS